MKPNKSEDSKTESKKDDEVAQRASHLDVVVTIDDISMHILKMVEEMRVEFDKQVELLSDALEDLQCEIEGVKKLIEADKEK